MRLRGRGVRHSATLIDGWLMKLPLTLRGREVRVSDRATLMGAHEVTSEAISARDVRD